MNKELIEKLKKDFNIKDNQMVIGCVARLTEQKSIPTLIKALQILKKNKLNFKLLLIGRGELEAEIRALVAQLNLQDEVVLTGFREDIPALMNLFDIFALPSLYEGLGLVFLEAMAAGKPVITCNVSAMPEIISENNTGYLIPTKNTKELANKIELLSCPEHRQRFSNSCQNWIDKNFTVDKMLRETLNTYIS